MKRFIRPQIIVVGATIVALVALSSVVSAAGHRSQLIARSAELQVEASPEPEHQNAAQQLDEVPEPAEKPENEHQVVNPPPAPAPTVSTKTFALVGGSVTFRCTGNVISLVSAIPNSGFKVETETEHGGQQIKAEFESAMHKSEIKASCVGGQVQANEIREESESH